MRDTADAVAASCVQTEFLERRGDKEGGCRRLAEEVIASVSDEIWAVLQDHKLKDFFNEVKRLAVDELATMYLQTLDEQPNEDDSRVMAGCVVRNAVGVAEGLEETLQLVFDVWKPDEEPVTIFRMPDDRTRSASPQPVGASESIAARAGRLASGDR